MKEQIKNNVPSALKNNDLIDEYLEVVGEVFDEIRQEINYKSFETDYAKAKPATLVRVAADLGFNLSPKLRPSVLRRIIRDAQDVFSRMGTRGSLEWALKTVGYRSFDIDEVWVPNPDLLRMGYFRELKSEDEPRRYDVRKGSYSDFVVGEEYVTPEGTFFEGFVYNDFEKEDPIDGIPIYGERYSTYTGLSFKDMVSKTPYLLARLYDPPEYDDVISDVDPVTGEPVFVDIQEKQRIIVNTIRSLIQELQRTATTKVILVSDLLLFDVLVPRVLDTIEFEATQIGFDWTDVMPDLADDYETDVRIKAAYDTGYLTVGNKLPIGSNYPVPAIGEYTGHFKVGVVDASVREIHDAIRTVNESHEVVNPPSGYEHVVYLDYGANVSFTAPSGVSVTVKSARNYHYSTSTQTITTVSAGASFNQTIPDSHALILEFNAAYQGKVPISVTY